MSESEVKEPFAIVNADDFYGKNAFKKRIGLTHWPNYFNKNGMGEFLPNVETDKI